MPDAEQNPQYVLLDAVQGWRIAVQSALHADAAGRLTLQPLPGEGVPLLEAGAIEQSGMQCPAGIATDGCGGIVVIDAGNDSVYRIALAPTLATRQARREPDVGGHGSVPRRFAAARGIAVLPDGGFAVADTGNARIQEFAAPSRVLTGLWHDLPARQALTQPWHIVVSACGDRFVVDRGSGRVWQVDRAARTAVSIGEHLLRDPVRIAVSAGGAVAIADVGAAAVVYFAPSQRSYAVRLTKPDMVPWSVAFDDGGTLYVGDGIGLIHVAPDPAQGVYAPVGAGDTRVTGRVLDLVWDRGFGLVALIDEEDDDHGRRRRLWQIATEGAYAKSGVIVSEAIDSKFPACEWHRVRLQADFVAPTLPASGTPGTASIEIQTLVTDDLAVGQAQADGGEHWKPVLVSGDADPDALVQQNTGRYLWLRLVLRSNGMSSPRLSSVRMHFPRQSYLDHLPAIYQDDEQSRRFLERFLSIFQSELDAQDARIDRMWLLFDPAATPQRYLRWLAEWVGLTVDPEWPVERLRSMIHRAYAHHLTRGTLRGIEQAINDYADLPARVVEHFRLRAWSLVAPAEASQEDADRTFWMSVAARDGSRRLWSRHYVGGLQLDRHGQIGAFRLASQPEPVLEPFAWGAHRFTVFFPADPDDVEAARVRVAAIVAREKPAHTDAELCPVYPRMRVGRQAMVGVDSRVGGIGHFTLGRLATLNFDTILGCSESEIALRKRGASPRPRVGATTRLQ